MKILANNLNNSEKSELEAFSDIWFFGTDDLELQTSGSTGAKKLIRAPRQYLKESATITGNFFHFTCDSILLHALPFSFIAGKMMFVRMAEFCTQAVFVSPSSPLDFPDAIVPDFVALTPFQYQKCLSENPKKLQRIKTVLLGGGPIEPGLEAQITASGQRVFHSYGMTETYSHVALREVGRQSHFLALDGISFSISDDHTLIINAPKIGVQNLGTTDIVELISSTEFIFKGRKDFVINSGGIKLHPEELEKKIAAHYSDTPFFFAGVPDKILGEKLVLYLESQDYVDLDAVFKNLSKFEIPKNVIYCKHFSYTESGKINRMETIKTNPI